MYHDGDDELDDLEPEVEEEDGWDGPSRSQEKRDAQALQALGERLMGMSEAEWKKFPLEDSVLDALRESRRVRGHIALRRHIRRIGKLLRHTDAEAVQAVLDQMDNQHMEDNRRFHRLEQLRDRLITEGDAALTEFMAEHPQAEAGSLRQLIRTARRERDQEKPPAAARKLFKLLRQIKGF